MSWSRHRPCGDQWTRLPGFGLAPESGLILGWFRQLWEVSGGRLVVNILVTPPTLPRLRDLATRIRAGARIGVDLAMVWAGLGGEWWQAGGECPGHATDLAAAKGLGYPDSGWRPNRG